MPAHVIDVDSQHFDQQVLAASQQRPVLVDFWAPWCQPCRSLGPILEKLAAEYEGAFLLAKVDSDQNQALALRFDVRSIPSVKAFVGGAVVDEFSGAQAEGDIRHFIERLLPSPGEPLRLAALAAMADGDLATAHDLLRQALQADPRLEAGWFDLADLYLDMGELEQATKLIERLGNTTADRPENQNRLDALRAKLTLIGSVGPIGAAEEKLKELDDRIAADPADLAARLELGNLLAVGQDFESAMAQFLEIVRRDRSFEDQAGRKALVNLFTVLGSGDPRVRAYRSQLAALLNV